MADAGDLLAKLAASAHTFLQPTPDLHVEAIACLKTLLDPLASNVAREQQSRRSENRKKRKRRDVEREDDVLQLTQVYTDGLGVKQVWEQARRVLDAASVEVEREIAAAISRSPPPLTPPTESEEGEADREDWSDALDGDGESSEHSESDDHITRQEDWDPLENEHDAEADEDDPNSDASITDPGGDATATYVPDPHHLNDGFFSIDDFNRQTQILEQQDAMGENEDPSDEDEVDWDADPLAIPPLDRPGRAENARAKGRDTRPTPKEDSDDEHGPTFGDADLGAHDSDDDMVDMDDMDVDQLDDDPTALENTNEIRYADFFAPPPKKLSRSKRMRALPKTQPDPSPAAAAEQYETDLQRAISDVRRDLLDSDEEVSGVESGSDQDGADGSFARKGNMSTHEKQRAVIAAEIRRLEAANVAKRDWTLSGEARALDRPLNSLIEEDLEFERVGKPVPVITTEVSEEIEALIKRRILAREFDEVVRRHPDAVGHASQARRGRVDLDDTKPQTGLAEVYEQDHLRATDPNFVDKRSAATMRQHDEIALLWKEVANQLDTLSNLHFKPKRVEAAIKTVEDRPVIDMEDARPVGLGANGDASMLAPQDIYRPGNKGPPRGADGDAEALVVHKGGASVHKDEMTRDEKTRRRRRQKERAKKAQPKPETQGRKAADTQHAPDAQAKSKDRELASLISNLRKGNVKVVGKNGELEDLGGKRAKVGARTGTVSSGGGLKL